MKFISLFAGIGGFDLALTRQGHECVWANEWDKYAAQIYDKNFNQNTQSLSSVKQDSQGRNGTLNQDRPDSLLFGHSQSTGNRIYVNGNTVCSEKYSSEQQGLQNDRNIPNTTSQGNGKNWNKHTIDTRDIRTVPTEEIPDHDLLVGGFPCQAFSIAGKRKGFDDTRGTLFFEIARILREKHPRLFILENVKGLLSHDNGNTFKTIISTLDELGYDLQWQVLNSKNFGVPQNRERVFIIGNLRGTSRPEVFPIRQDERLDNETRTENRETIPCLEATMYKGISSERFYGIQQLNNPDHSNARVYSSYGLSPTLNTMQGGNRQPKIVYKETVKALEELKKEGVIESYSNPIIKNITTSKIRRLTPIECERLQGFPDNWTSGVSDTQRYKMCGNAVTVNVVSYLVSKL